MFNGLSRQVHPSPQLLLLKVILNHFIEVIAVQKAVHNAELGAAAVRRAHGTPRGPPGRPSRSLLLPFHSLVKRFALTAPQGWAFRSGLPGASARSAREQRRASGHPPQEARVRLPGAARPQPAARTPGP